MFVDRLCLGLLSAWKRIPAPPFLTVVWQARKYVESQPLCQTVPFETLYPHADPKGRPELVSKHVQAMLIIHAHVALDLLRAMLTFNPDQRVTVEQALAHPYLEQYYDPTDEPVAERRMLFSACVLDMPACMLYLVLMLVAASQSRLPLRWSWMTCHANSLNR